MPRRVQDIVPGDRRGIRDIPVEKEPSATAKGPGRRASVPTDEKDPRGEDASKERAMPIRRVSRAGEAKKEDRPVKEPPRDMPIMPPAARPRKGKKRLWLLLTLGIIVVIAGAAYAASTYFSHATFTIVPRSIPVSVNSTYIAQDVPSPGTLAYELIALHGSASSTVPA